MPPHEQPLITPSSSSPPPWQSRLTPGGHPPLSTAAPFANPIWEPCGKRLSTSTVPRGQLAGQLIPAGVPGRPLAAPTKPINSHDPITSATPAKIPRRPFISRLLFPRPSGKNFPQKIPTRSPSSKSPSRSGRNFPKRFERIREKQKKPSFSNYEFTKIQKIARRSQTKISFHRRKERKLCELKVFRRTRLGPLPPPPYREICHEEKRKKLRNEAVACARRATN